MCRVESLLNINVCSFVNPFVICQVSQPFPLLTMVRHKSPHHLVRDKTVHPAYDNKDMRFIQVKAMHELLKPRFRVNLYYTTYFDRDTNNWNFCIPLVVFIKISFFKAFSQLSASKAFTFGSSALKCKSYFETLNTEKAIASDSTKFACLQNTLYMLSPLIQA